VLVLSQFAGAAQELTSALIVNPYDIEATAAAIACAFTMALDERRGRWHAIMGSFASGSALDEARLPGSAGLDRLMVISAASRRPGFGWRRGIGIVIRGWAAG
jgi:Glycosyltransferase family 20